MSDEYVKVAAFYELRDDAGIQRTVGDREVGLFRDGDGVLAIDESVPTWVDHWGRFVEDGKVLLPLHGWPFDLKTAGVRRTSGPRWSVFKPRSRTAWCLSGPKNNLR